MKHNTAESVQSSGTVQAGECVGELTVAKLKNLSKDTTLHACARTVLLAKANAELTREKVDAYIEPLFQSYGFTVDRETRTGDKGKPIAHSDKLYLSTDQAKQTEFYAECDHAHRQHGYADLKPGQCPALIAENLMITAENHLLAYALPHLGVDPTGAVCQLENRRKMIDLLLTLAVKGAPRGMFNSKRMLRPAA